MRYQIQKYKTSDYTDREVLDRREGLMNDTDLQQWVNSVIASQEELDPEYSIVPVPESHEWFKHENPNTSVASAVADTSVQSSNKTSMEGEPVDFQIVARYELEQSQKRRQEKFEADRKLAENIAKLSI